MARKMNLGLALLSGASLAAIAGPAFAQQVSSEIVVTAQKREQAIQDVPIAVSAFGETQLQDQGLNGGYNLLQAIPNVTFSKANFTTYNFQIRGVGYKNVSAGSDTGVGVHLNNAPLTTNRLFEADFYDVQRVEVLRGPQGTLYGRNATGGVVNVITRQPSGDFEGSLRGEAANYDSYRLTGVVNVPIVGDTLDLRVAATMLNRDGFSTNTYLNEAIDSRDIWAGRATLAFNPTENISAWLMYEHFEEDDDRLRVGKQLCATDNGPASIGGVALNPITRGFFSTGCRAAPLTDPASLGTVNLLGTLGGSWAAIIGAISGNSNAGLVQDPDFRHIQSVFDPIYQAEQDLGELNIDISLTDSLKLTSLTSYNEDSYFTFQDYNRIVPATGFNPIPGLIPGGVFCDPQLGCRDRVATADISSSNSKQWTQELRLQSSYDGPLNFSLGGMYMDYESEPTDYWVFSNSLTLTALANGAAFFVDFNNPPTGNGENYYLNRTALYQLKAWAAMGEVYYEPWDGFKFTLGVRYTDDQKDVFPVSPILFAFFSDAVPPPPPAPTEHQEVEFKETTGRIGFDWQVNTGFTDRTLLYAFYSRGYKGGGFNPPGSVGIQGVRPVFDPEFVDSYEIGTKNTLADGRMILNLTGFHYDYEGYQISKIVNRTSVNENIDATVDGAELEVAWEPVDGLRFNGTFGWLDTEITGGSSIDTLDRTQGDGSLTVVHDPFGAQNCAIPTAVLLSPFSAPFGTVINFFNAIPAAMGGICDGGGSAAVYGGDGHNPFFDLTTEGHAVALKGHELPNAPNWTFNLGLEYTWQLGSGWEATLRGDYYRQGDSFMRIFNTAADTLDGYSNLNLLLRVAEPSKGLTIELFGQNVTDEVAITDSYLTDDSSGLFRNIFLTEPRTFGLRIGKEF